MFLLLIFNLLCSASLCASLSPSGVLAEMDSGYRDRLLEKATAVKSLVPLRQKPIAGVVVSKDSVPQAAPVMGAIVHFAKGETKRNLSRFDKLKKAEEAHWWSALIHAKGTKCIDAEVEALDNLERQNQSLIR